MIEAGKRDRITPGNGAAVTIGSNTVAVFNVDGAIFAVEGWCLRCGACLANGRLRDRILVCCNCDWRYDVITGSVAGMPALRLHTFEAKVVDGEIIVAIA